MKMGQKISLDVASVKSLLQLCRENASQSFTLMHNVINIEEIAMLLIILF